MIVDLEKIAALAESLPPSGPRYTSYPTANHFFEGDFTPQYQAGWDVAGSTPLSVYIHVPFCATVCYYCACNKIHTANKRHTQSYLAHLLKEIELQANVVGGTRQISQLHFGGGTPTSLTAEQMRKVFDALAARFGLNADEDRDFSIEIDPRSISGAELAGLIELGINRVSIGVQDFDPQVQRAVNRIQTLEETARIVDAARAAGVQSVNVDLIYGLPYQTRDSFAASLQRTMELDPDRLSVYNYAHLPQMFKIQRQIDTKALPHVQDKLGMFLDTVATLQMRGYEYLGMDHFAKRQDSLTQAMQANSMQRNFMGYSTHAHCDILALGPSSIGQTDYLYTQNHKTLDEYYQALEAEQLPIFKGLKLTEDDVVRRSVIQSLMCTMHIDKAQFTAVSGVPFEAYFGDSLSQIARFQAAGLVVDSCEYLRVTDLGRFFLRNIAMLFDSYLQGSEIRFSQIA